MDCDILLTKGDKHFVESATEVCYAEADDRYTHLHLLNGKRYTQRALLKCIENKLAPSGLFLKIGRSLLINRSQIDHFTRHTLYMECGSEIPLTESLYSDLVAAFG